MPGSKTDPSRKRYQQNELQSTRGQKCRDQNSTAGSASRVATARPSESLWCGVRSVEGGICTATGSDRKNSRQDQPLKLRRILRHGCGFNNTLDTLASVCENPYSGACIAGTQRIMKQPLAEADSQPRTRVLESPCQRACSRSVRDAKTDHTDDADRRLPLRVRVLGWHRRNLHYVS